MSSRHRDPCKSPSLRAATPRTPRRAQLRASSESTSPRCSSGSAPGLIVTRGLYKVLEEEMQERPSARQASSRGGGQGARPNFLFCYLCGLQFGSASLPIHQPQCYVKKLIEWERMDPARRGPRPLNPEEHEKQMKEWTTLGGASGASAGGRLRRKQLDRFNELQIEHFNTNMLLKCGNCGRTFLPDRLEVHQRSCKPGAASASRPVTRPSAGRNACGNPPRKTRSESAPARSSPKSTGAVPLDERPLPVAAQDAALTETARSSAPATPQPQPAGVPLVSSVALGNDSLAETPPRVDAPFSLQEDTDGDEGTNVGGDAAASAAPDAPDATSSVARRLTTVNAKSSVQPEEALRGSAVAVAVEKQSTSNEAQETPKQSAVSLGLTDDGRRENPPVDDALPSAGSDATDPAAATAAFASAPTWDDSQPCDDDAAVQRRVVKIPLNNVSRFKNVASRLQADLHKAEELPRCRFCNRTFNVGRLAKHEDVCLERNKPRPRNSASADHHPLAPAAAHEANKKHGRDTPRGGRTGSGAGRQQQQPPPPPPPEDASPPTASAPGVATAKSARSPPQPKSGTAMRRGSTEGKKLRFCFECGVKLHAGTQRFCAECGTKLIL
ncbi:uncharacterized protein Tco025E_00210 [Trypanosoma conorhini]|uniref:C2HC/C3H-type domain-containing protein n=1 Tax=Trypanosoma conorhini TaxID=83891 RepID=A0A422QC52_9TRYP|nr:uncharacterized protein Tco025E_00210 [Trypanosoma conorhini]RNF27560.1 hypothetical protein Tco025E_00210 [Trypanosoma conorhini]